MTVTRAPALSGLARHEAFTSGLELLADQIDLLELQLRQLVHEYATHETPFGMRRFVPSELALLFRVSPRSAKLLVEDAELLCAHPCVMAKVASRAWTLKHADAALDALMGAALTPEQQEQVLDLVLGQHARTPWEVRKAVQAAIILLFPELVTAASEQADLGRSVAVYQDRPGQGTFCAHGTPAQVQQLWAALDAQLGPAEPGETRTRTQRMFDLLTDLVCGRADAGQWQAYVVMTFETLIGTSQAPAEIPGLGLIPADQARDLAARAELRRTLVDDNGELVTLDSRLHRPDPATAEPAAGAEDPSRATSARRSTLQDEPVHEPDLEDEQPSAEDVAFADALADGRQLDQDWPYVQLCPDALDRALERLLNDALIRTGSASPSHASASTPAGSPPDTLDHPDDDDPPPGGSAPPSGGPPPERPPDRPLQPDAPPSAADRDWYDDNADDALHDQHEAAYLRARPGARTYLGEGGPCQPHARQARPVLWTRERLRAALTTMLTAPLEQIPFRSSSYALPPRMARHVKTRDHTCSFPGCQRLAVACQSDHVTPWPEGRTELTNIASDCTHHHQSKTERFFHVRKDSDGVHWTTRSGRTYTEPPRPLLRGW